jgi:hypothetical protein
MKKILTYALLALVLTGSTVTFNACKKGKDDPFLSLRSRNARLIGKWKLSKMEGTYTANNSTTSSISNQTISRMFDGTAVTKTYTSSSTISGTTTTQNITEKSTLTMELEILKDGTTVLTKTSSLTSTTQTSSPVVVAPIQGMPNGVNGSINVGDESVNNLVFDGTYTYGVNSSANVQNGRWYWLESSKSKVNVTIDVLGTFYVKSLKNKTLVLESIDSDNNTTTAGSTSTNANSNSTTYTFVQ